MSKLVVQLHGRAASCRVDSAPGRGDDALEDSALRAANWHRLATLLGAEPIRTTGLLAVLFTDIVGSTELTALRGDEDARAIRTQHDKLVRKQLTAHRGREVQTTGDGFLVTFSSVRSAVSCACGIQLAQAKHNQRHPDQALSLRLGLNAGEVSFRDDGLFGSAVNLAARVMAKAGPGEILVTEVVKLLVGIMPEVEFRDRGRFRLRGLPSRWRLFELAWSSDITTNPAADGTTNGHVEQRARLQSALGIMGLHPEGAPGGATRRGRTPARGPGDQTFS